MEQTSEILIYQTEDNETRIETRLLDETVWLTQRIRIDRESEANHDLIRLLDKPGVSI